MTPRARITVAGVSAIVCMVCGLLWARSYRKCDLLWRAEATGWRTAIGSEDGSFYVIPLYAPQSLAGYISLPTEEWRYDSQNARGRWPGYGFALTSHKKRIQIPYYVFVSIALPIAIVIVRPWLRQFSLRALLVIATIAVLYLGCLALILR